MDRSIECSIDPPGGNLAAARNTRNTRNTIPIGGTGSLPTDPSPAEIAAQPDDRSLNPAKKPAKKTQPPAMTLQGTAVSPLGLPSNSMGVSPAALAFPSNSLSALNLPSNSLTALASSRGHGVTSGNSGNSGNSGTGKGNRRSKKNKMMKNAEQYVIDPRKVESNEDPRQFLMIRNIPNSISQEELLSILETYVQGEIEFLYLPIDKVTSCNLGYGYVSLLNCSSVLKLYNAVGGWRDVSCRCIRRDGRSHRV